MSHLIHKAQKGVTLNEAESLRCFVARDEGFSAICMAAGCTTRDVVGDTRTYVITRNINYTTSVHVKCQFCGLFKGKTSEALRGKPYLLSLRRDSPGAWSKRGTRPRPRSACREAFIPTTPEIPISTFVVRKSARRTSISTRSLPLEIQQGRADAGPVAARSFPALKAAGLGTLPGTAAQNPRRRGARHLICRTSSNQDLVEVMRTAHRLGNPQHCHDHVRTWSIAT